MSSLVEFTVDNTLYSIPEFPYELVLTEEHLGEVLSSLDRHEELGFDFETTGLNYILDKPVGMSLANKDKAWYISGAAFNSDKLKDWQKREFNNPNRLWIGHNAKFDLHFAYEHLRSFPSIFDTQLAQWMVNENTSLALKDLANTRLGIPNKLPSYGTLQKLIKQEQGLKKMDQVKIDMIPLKILGPYGALDSRLAFDLKYVLEKDLIEQEMLQIFHEEVIPFSWVLLRMERNGIEIDLPKVEYLLNTHKTEYEELLEQWDKKTKGVNPRSPLQLKDYFFGELKLKSDRKTPSGAKSTDYITLLRIKKQDKTGAVDLLLNIRNYEKIIGTYLESMLARNINGRIYTNLNQTGTVTGRLSSSADFGLNLQNIPARTELGGEVRGAFIARPGYKIICVDYSQVELRILAHFCRDANLVRAFLWGTDVHQMTANKLGTARFIGKTMNFLTIYGGGPRAAGDNIEKTGKERPNDRLAKKWLDDYDRAFPAIPNWKAQEIRYAHANGYIKTIGGRRRHAEGLDHPSLKIRGRAERQLINSKVQGSAGDVINHAMLTLDYLAPFLEKTGSRLLLQVHDEIVIETPEEQDLQYVAQTVKEYMEAVGTYYNISVPILAEPGVGDNWKEAKV